MVYVFIETFAGSIVKIKDIFNSHKSYSLDNTVNTKEPDDIDAF